MQLSTEFYPRMKFLHTAFLLLLIADLIQAQSLQLGPAQGNPLLRSVAAQKELQNAQIVEALTGHYPSQYAESSRSATCPPEVEGYIVESGKSIEIEIDTFGLMNGEDSATITLENGSGLLYGTAVFDQAILLLTYSATSGLTGANTETVQLKLSQPGHDTLFTVEVLVRRKGRIVVTQPQTVQPESITTFCLDDELDFALPKVCAGSRDELDDYDGRAYIVQFLSSYDYPDTCLVYYASRFPGVDTISMTICDEWGVCDLFKVPYIIPGDTLSIATNPFFDDFSAYEGVYPTGDLWLDNSVYRNTTWAKDPPSVGFVTFDGLNFRGDSYNIVQGIGDRLTSKAIDLSNYNAASKVSLRFFVAPKGYGFEPDITDEFTIEFRNNQREWVKVATFVGTGNVPRDSIPPFIFNGIAVDDPQFFHEAFQFRFNAVTSPGGVMDLWHLDYVILSINAESSNRNFQDIAFTKLPTSLLKNYTSLPWNHFKEDVDGEITDQYVVGFFNHTDQPANLDNSDVNYVETTTNFDFNQHFSIEETGGNIPVRVPFERFGTIPPTRYDEIKDKLKNNIPDGSFRNLQTNMHYELSGQTSYFKVNDTIALNIPFSNYFAHDDGTAEWQAVFDSPTGLEQFASKFHTHIKDTLKYVQIMFPQVNIDISSQLFNLNIWIGQLDTTPEFSRPLLKPLLPSLVYDTLQGFTTYILDDFGGNPLPLEIPANTDFYVGFQQETAGTYGIPIGFDLQNPCDCNWFSFDAINWLPLPSSYKGALMIRPVFGESKATSQASEVTDEMAVISLYPNPTNGKLNIDLQTGNYQDYKMTIFNSLGQLVMHAKMAPSIDLSALSNGVYFIGMINEKTGEILNRRIVLAKN
jgi:Secretion system C-terminal sorting domain